MVGRRIAVKDQMRDLFPGVDQGLRILIAQPDRQAAAPCQRRDDGLRGRALEIFASPSAADDDVVPLKAIPGAVFPVRIDDHAGPVGPRVGLSTESAGAGPRELVGGALVVSRATCVVIPRLA